jgi:hypothetical protein
MSNNLIEIANELKSTGINYKPAFAGSTIKIALDPNRGDYESIVIPSHSGMMAAVLTATSDGSVVYFFERYGKNGCKTTQMEYVSVLELMGQFDEFVIYGCG